MCYEEEFEYEYTDDFTNELNKLIKGEIKARMETTVNDLEAHKEIVKDLRTKISELSWKVRNSEPELKKALREKELEVKREIFNGFSPGDTAYTTKYKFDTKPCEKCSGKRKVQALVLGEEVEVECPHCRGRGNISESWLEPQKVDVRTVSLELSKEGKHIKYYYGYDYSEARLLFKTEQECQEYCDSKNKEKG